MCGLPVDGEESHASPEECGHCLLHPSNVLFIDPRIQVAHEIVIHQGHGRNLILRQRVTTVRTYGNPTIQTQFLVSLARSFANLIFGATDEAFALALHFENVRIF